MKTLGAHIILESLADENLFDQAHPLLRVVLAEAARWTVLTQVGRTDALVVVRGYRPDAGEESLHAYVPLRAVDLGMCEDHEGNPRWRKNGLRLAEAKEFQDYLRDRFGDWKASDGSVLTMVYMKPHGTAPHVHLQVPMTKKDWVSPAKHV